MTSGLGQSNRSMPSAVSPAAERVRQRDEEAALERADLRHRPGDAQLVCMRIRPQQMAAAKRDDMPGTPA